VGKWDDALAAYDKAATLEPGNLATDSNRGPVLIVTERWGDFATLNQRLLASNDARWKFQALQYQAIEQQYRGRSADAIRLMDSAAAVLGARGSTMSAGARLGVATLLMDRGQPETALVSAKRAYDDAGGIGATNYFALELVGRLHGRLGHKAEMAKAEDDLTRIRKQLPSERLQRVAQHGHEALLALDRHDKRHRDTAAQGS
jgi:tetratricopeptide (TPR) repeat protein